VWLGFRTGGTISSHAEKPPRHLLPRADLEKRAIFRRVEVDLQRLLMCVPRFAFHAFRGYEQNGLPGLGEPERGARGQGQSWISRAEFSGP
jgi:hypothetical protein